VEFAFPPLVPVQVSTALVIIPVVAIFFAWLTRLAFPPAKSAILRICSLVAVAISLFVCVIAVADAALEAFDGSHYPTALLVAWIVIVIAAIGGAAVKFRRSDDRPLRLTVIVVGLGAFVLAFLGSQTATGRSAALLARCKKHVQGIGDAFRDVGKTRGQFPDAVEESPHRPPQSWRVNLLPMISRRGSIGYDFNQSWDSAVNLPLAQTEIESYSCPAVGIPRDEQERWLSPFALVTGPGTIFPNGKSLLIKDVTDGLTNTLLAVEAVGLGIVWSEPRDFDVSKGKIGFDLPGSAPGRSPALLSSYHPHCANAVMGDGSVVLLSDKIDPNVLKALTTAAGHDSIEGFRAN
jgi:hypothetical protein